jgi:methionyl-tRNA formyltransferase
MKIVYFGTPQFAAHVLQYLLDRGISVAAVITKPDKPKGRSGSPQPTPVKLIAIEHHIPVYQPPLVSVPEFAETLQAFYADLFVVVAYGEIMKQHLLDMPKLGCINLHASLLPKYRGAAPIQHAIINGETETGVTIMHMVKKMDAGDMIQTVKVPIGPDTTYGELEENLCEAGCKALLETIHALEKGTAQRTPQDHEQATLAPKIELENCEIHWEWPAEKIHNLIRGVFPFPGAWCRVQLKGQLLRLKISKSQIAKGSGPPGQILSYGKEGFIIACGEDALRLLEVQLEGKKSVKAEEFIRGVPREQIGFTSI